MDVQSLTRGVGEERWQRKGSRRGLMGGEMSVGTALLLPGLPGFRPGASAASSHDHGSAGDTPDGKDFEPGAPFVEPETRRSGERRAQHHVAHALRL